jgi:hypothetical protein
VNNDRRKEIEAVAPLLRNALAIIAEARGIIESAKDDESEALEALPQGMKDGDKGETMQAAVNALEEAVDGLQSLDLSGVIQSLEEATDRTLDVEALVPTLTDDERDQRRYDRLPTWAKDEMARLIGALTATEAKMQAMFSDPVEGSKRPIIGDWNSPLSGKEIPAQRVEFPQVGITVEIERGQLKISGHNSLMIMPEVSNVVRIATHDGRR